MSKYNQDPLIRFSNDLKNKNLEIRKKAALNLRIYVESESREKSSDNFIKFMNELNRLILELVNSSNVEEKMGGIMVIDEFIDIPYEENETKIIRFANYLRMVFQQPIPNSDATILEAAAKALGHLARVGGTLTSDVVESEVKRALEWLQGDRTEQRRHAAVLVLKALAENAPTLFNVHVSAFLDHVWIALRDTKLEIRESAILSLRACLLLISKRASRWRIQWYYKIYGEAQKGFKNANNADSIHGSLLTIGELLVNSGDFMLARFKEVSDSILKYKDNSNRLVRRTVITLIPLLSNFCPDAFVRGYLDACLNHLIETLKGGHIRDASYLALGEMAVAVGIAIIPQLDIIVALVKDGLSRSRGKTFVETSLTCVAKLTKAVKNELLPYMRDLIDQMFSTGLSETLIDSLTELVQILPDLLPLVQDRLLATIASILGRPAIPQNNSSSTPVAPASLPNKGHLRLSLYGGPPPGSTSVTLAISSSSVSINGNVGVGGIVSLDASASLYDPPTDISDATLITLSLKTLGSFDFSQRDLLSFVRECVLAYLDDDNQAIRREAALTCSQLLLTPVEKATTSKAISKKLDSSGGEITLSRYNSSDINASSAIYMSPVQILMVGDVLERLLTVGISDPDWNIRKTILASLDSRCDHYLAQAENLHSLFIALNDEVFAIREVAISIIGRLAVRNPAYVMPSLRKTLIQLLTELQFSGDTRNREESSRLLGHLIAAAQRLIKPYVTPILNVLLPKLLDTDVGVSSSVLSTIGQLAATVDGEDIIAYLDRLLPYVVDSLRDKSSQIKREVALRSLGQFVQSTGLVIEPYLKFKKLLPAVLEILKTEQSWSIRREAIKVLGILGALDPYKHKINQIELHLAGEDKIESISRPINAEPLFVRQNAPVGDGNADAGQEREPDALAPNAVTSITQDLTPSSEDYYPTVAIHALMRILRDSGLSQHHHNVIQAVMFIFRSLGLKCVPFLPHILPHFLFVMRNGEDSLRDVLFTQLGSLVGLVRSHIRNYLDGIFELVHEYWNDSDLLPQILILVEEISLALKDEFKVHLPVLIPLFLHILHTDKTEKRLPTLRVLHALETFGLSLDDYLYLVIPPVIKLCEAVDAPVNVRRISIQTIGRLCRILNFADYASRVVHPLARILDSSSSTISSISSNNSSTVSPTLHALREDAIDTLCALLYQLGTEYIIFIPMIDKILAKNRLSYDRYTSLINKLVKSQPISHNDVIFSATLAPIDENETTGLGMDTPDRKDDLLPAEQPSVKRLHVNQANLKKAWESTQRSTKDDWIEWMRRFSVELLKESPSPALRSCSALAQKYQSLARELFHAAFVSCWTELHDQYQDDLVRSLETAFKSVNIPPEILQSLLNLAEFMEHDDKALPIDIRTLGSLAEKCHAYAKALHYKELEFHTSPSATIEALISINNQLQQPEAAVGILEYAQQHHAVELKESWYEKLTRWEDALEAYERKQLEDPLSVDLMLGRMRCLKALGEWERLSQLSLDVWSKEDVSARRDVASLGAAAEWNLGRWDRMEEYVDLVDKDGSDGNFFRAILCVRRNDFSSARFHIDNSRHLLDTELFALVGESYNRAYRIVVQVQQLAELEEIINYKESDSNEHQSFFRKMWAQRLKGCQRNVEVWQSILAVRSLVIRPEDDIPTWLKFSSLCRKSGRLALSLKVLIQLLGSDPSQSGNSPIVCDEPLVVYAYLKHLWAAGFQQNAYERLTYLIDTLSASDNTKLKAKCFLKLGEWHMAMTEEALKLSEPFDPQTPNRKVDHRASILGFYGSNSRANNAFNSETMEHVLNSFHTATKYDPSSYKAWHAWALANYQMVTTLERGNFFGSNQESNDALGGHLQSAVFGFFRSISLAKDKSLQDVLRLLTLWFKHGSRTEVEQALVNGFSSISIDTWLDVIPQIIARIHTPQPPIRRLILELLTRVGKTHPQALIYPLTVASKSQATARKEAAQKILDKMRNHSAVLVDQAILVSKELIRVAILWHEMWHEALEESSRLYFGASRNIEGMFTTLAPLHEMMEKGPETLREVAFQQAFGRDLQEAHDWCKKFTRSGKDSDINQAWELYYHVFRRINKQLPQMTELELQYVSPKLLAANDMELAVPGTYKAGQPVVRIASFVVSLRVIESKQRPRKLTIIGSDGLEYSFLLKGHEDLRQDERVMQLFGLVNTLLTNDSDTSKQDLSIQRYSVIPLSPNSGLIEWLPHCDTLHALIKEYREKRKILLNIEHRLMLQMAQDFPLLTLIQKVEVFEYALANTTGQDLYKVLWLKSQNSEIWLDRRTNYTRSLAVMSMVGYVLGLGDRHPCNLMLDRYTGKIIHIDFGDCFEVAMQREKFPEKIPFRLTRLLINAMEVSGIEGNFRTTCSRVMRVLRENKESVMAVLEAFVHDPLINWRLLKTNVSPRHDGRGAAVEGNMPVPEVAAIPNMDTNAPIDDGTRANRGDLERELMQRLGPEGDAAPQEVLNERAVVVISRVSNKLTGRDFDNESLDVNAQVRRLIRQATSHENLCQCYVGWCPFW